MSKEFLAQMLALGSVEDVREGGIVRAPFAWPGGKSKSLENILPHLPYREAYCEPFGGSGAVMLARNGSPLEIFNDRFSGVTCFYRVIRDRTKMNALMDRLNLCLHSREEFTWCRATWKDCEDEVERAARWYYMVATSFGAQARTFGRCTRGKAQIGPKIKNNLKHFPEVHRRLLDVQIENQDWRAVLKDFDSPDMVWYLDPPYYQSTKGQYECDMPDSDHRELLERVWHLKGFVAISGYTNPMYESYAWDKRYTWKQFVTSLSQAFTETNNLADQTVVRGFSQECLWIKESRR